MLESLFIDFLNMSFSAGWLILVVLVLRMVFRNAPKNFRYFLWLTVAIRLIGGFSVESSLSLAPRTNTIPADIGMARVPAIDSGIEVIDQVVNPVVSTVFATSPITSVNPLQIVLYISSVIWIVGIVCMLLYLVISYIRLKKSVRASIRLRDRIWLCDQVESPFILGLFFPRIYLPSDTKEEDIPYIVAHEEEHLRYHDTWWKPLGYILLALHWFNPLVWLAYILMCKDMEMACDERVIWTLDGAEKKRYSEVLFSFGDIKHSAVSCPVAFGEIGIKQRIKSIVDFRKPSGWIVIMFIFAAIAMGIFFMTNPPGHSDLPDVGPGPSKDDEPADDIMSAFQYLRTRDYTFSQYITVGQEESATLYQKLSGECDTKTDIIHLVHVEGQKDWAEMYRYKKGDKHLLLMMGLDGEWTEMESDGRPYFYGDRKKLTLDTAYNAMHVEKDLTVIYSYQTYYTVDVGALYDLPIDLKAMVTQTYGVEKETGLIRSIYTELYELQEKLVIANQMDLHGLSYEEALEKLEEIKEQATIIESDYVEFTYEDVQVELP